MADLYANHLNPKNFTWAEIREHLIVVHRIDARRLDDERWGVDVRSRRHTADIWHEECHAVTDDAVPSASTTDATDTLRPEQTA